MNKIEITLHTIGILFLPFVGILYSDDLIDPITDKLDLNDGAEVILHVLFCIFQTCLSGCVWIVLLWYITT